MKASLRLAALVMCAGLVGAACNSSGHQSSPTTTGPVPSTAPSSSSSSSAAATTPPLSSSTTSAATAGAPQNLPADATVKGQLLAAFAAAKGNPQSYFTGPSAGSTYYAYVPSTNTYFAIADFGLTPSAPYQTQVGMQDGGSMGIFTRVGAGAWQVKFGAIPFPCPGQIPDFLVQLWGLQYVGSCLEASGTSPDRAPIQNNFEDSIPPGTYFGTLLSFDLDRSGFGDLSFEPKTWQAGSAPVSHEQKYVTLTFDSATTAEYWAGSSPSSSHQVSVHFDANFAGLVNNTMQSFATDPYYGYVIKVTIPPGCQGACLTASDIQQIGPNTPTPGNPNYTEP